MPSSIPHYCFFVFCLRAYLAYASAHVTRCMVVFLHMAKRKGMSADPFTDSCSTSRLLSHTFQSRVLNPAMLPPALQAIRRAIFPDDALGPARVPPSEDEVIAIKRECSRVIVEVLPPFIRQKYFATENVASMRHDVEGSLDLFADSYINKHLVVEIVELIVLRLFPEIAEERS